MTSEQEVRTRAGWIGVEISRSRVRTPGKAGYGLYRVRSAGRWRTAGARPFVRLGPWSDNGEWTPYAFLLTTVEAAVRNSIAQGTPAGPMDLAVFRSDVRDEDLSRDETGMIHLGTRWTSAYAGRRDLGVVRETSDEKAERRGRTHSAALDGPVGLAECGCPNRLDGASPLLRLCRRCGFEGGDALHGECAGCRENARTRQRAANAAFQAEHGPARDAGLRARHAAKLARNAQQADRGRSDDAR